ncbi:MAG TPA: response regulator, partial [Steroidobacteraceae bacterium]|nr:response regulator [Steroidobacteraceae bacterium]
MAEIDQRGGGLAGISTNFLRRGFATHFTIRPRAPAISSQNGETQANPDSQRAGVQSILGLRNIRSQVAAPLTEADEKRLLIVDDDPLLRRLCMTALRHAGYDLQEADSGERAVGSFASSRTDLVILDVQMGGIDGYETCRRIRRLPGGENVPVIMLTSLDDAGSIERAYEAGATDFIAKPFQWPLLTQRV